MRAQQVTDPVAYHGEGPVWSERWGGLRWVDMLAGDVLSLTNEGSVERRHIASIAACVRPRSEGGSVLGVERGFALESAEGEITMLRPLWTGDDVRMNEGGCDPDGRFYCGSMPYDKREGGGALYRLDGDHTAHVVLPHVTISNGLDWSPDGATAYYSDTATFRVDAFDYDAAHGLTRRRPFIDFRAEGGRPDGLVVDAEGGVWVALANAGVVRRYTVDGRLDQVVEIPATKVTACTFGGPRLDRLYITTSREGLEPGVEPLAGALFMAEVGAIGRPVREFAG